MSRLRPLFLLICFPPLLLTAQSWLVVQTPHFRMYTSGNSKDMMRVLQKLEQARSFFFQSNESQEKATELINIVAFSSEQEYKPYQINPAASGYYARDREQEYIVLPDIEPEHDGVALHEYTHSVMQHRYKHLPLWLREGVAELYSSLQAKPPTLTVGKPLLLRLAVLQQKPWMDWNRVFTIDTVSSLVNRPETMPMFYAQSWMAAHMLFFSSEYQRRLPDFLSELDTGLPTSEAFHAVFDKTVPELAIEIRHYLQSLPLSRTAYEIPLPPTEFKARALDLSPVDLTLVLSHLLGLRTETRLLAVKRLQTLSQEYPHHPEILESLGYLMWRDNNLQATRHYFSLAVAQGSQNSQMLNNLIYLEQNAGTDPETVASLLHQLLVLQPNHSEAKILLGELEANEGHYQAALSTVTNISLEGTKQKYRTFLLEAYCHTHLGQLNLARNFAQKASSEAQTPLQIVEAEKLLDFLHAKATSEAGANRNSSSLVRLQ